MSVKLREKPLKNGRTKLYLDIYYNGKRSYEYLDIVIEKNDPDKTEKKRIAKKICAKREIEVLSQKYDHIPNHKRNIDFIFFWESYTVNYIRKDIRMIKYSLEKFKLYTNKNKLPIMEIDLLKCEGFRDYLKDYSKSGLSGSTPYDYFKKFRKVMKAAMKEGYINNNPATLVSLTNMSRGSNSLVKEVLTPNELVSLASHPCKSNITKLTFLLACYTGMGMAEIRVLKWSQIKNDILTYSRAKVKESVVKVELNKSVYKIIGERKPDNYYVFPNIPSDPSISKSLKLWVRNAGINKNISFYCGRHTFGTLLVRNGANVRTAAELLGHKSLKHTFRYVKAVEEHKKEAIQNLPEIDI
ncbi:MAG: site-specific integrase [Chitinophagales bacterium]